MKIAVARMGNNVAEHFGHCENFGIYESENKAVLSEQSVANPGHKPGFLPNFLADMGVKVIISGGMGGGYQEPDFVPPPAAPSDRTRYEGLPPGDSAARSVPARMRPPGTGRR